MLPPRCKIYPLDHTELAELNKQKIELLKKKRSWCLIVFMEPLFYLPKGRMDDYVYALAIVL